MSHPPEHIPDMEHIDEKPKPVKDLKKKEEKLKEKVKKYIYVQCHLKRLISFVLFCSHIQAVYVLSAVTSECSLYAVTILFY